MRPCNFPERKNRRRKAALARIGNRKPKPSLTAEQRIEYMRRLDQETLALYERIVPSALLVVSRKFGGPHILNRHTRQPKVPPR